MLNEKEEAWSRTLQGMRKEMEEAVKVNREAQREFKEKTMEQLTEKSRVKVDRWWEKIKAMKIEWGDIHGQM